MIGGSSGRLEVPGARRSPVCRPDDALGANRGMDRLTYEKLSSTIIIFKYCANRVLSVVAVSHTPFRGTVTNLAARIADEEDKKRFCEPITLPAPC